MSDKETMRAIFELFPSLCAGFWFAIPYILIWGVVFVFPVELALAHMRRKRAKLAAALERRYAEEAARFAEEERKETDPR